MGAHYSPRVRNSVYCLLVVTVLSLVGRYTCALTPPIRFLNEEAHGCCDHVDSHTESDASHGCDDHGPAGCKSPCCSLFLVINAVSLQPTLSTTHTQRGDAAFFAGFRLSVPKRPPIA